MELLIATWNINSVRLREELVLKLLREQCPDILCLQECKSPLEKIPTQGFAQLGYPYMVARGQKGYNGVAIISRLPLEDAGALDLAALGDARHVAARLQNGLSIHNHYVPAGGDEPDREKNLKFGQKLDYLSALRDYCAKNKPQNAVLVGDLNIAPREDDVWDHKKLLKVVSHTPIEVEHLNDVMRAGGWHDITRQHILDGPLYSWWSYRAKDWQAADKGRRLDHIWASADIAKNATHSFIVKEARGWPRPSDHAPVFARFKLVPGAFSPNDETALSYKKQR